MAGAGEPVLMDVFNRAMARDIGIVITLSLLSIACFLALLVVFGLLSGLRS